MFNVSVHFQFNDIPLKSNKMKEIFQAMLTDHSVTACEIGVIFVDTNYITRLNQKYFKKTIPTDVISFPLSNDETKCLEGEIYICAEVARQQAEDYHLTWENELLRLAIHGLLHLLDYDDVTPELKHAMTQKEDYYLKIEAK